MRCIRAGSTLVALVLGLAACGGNKTSAPTATTTHSPPAPKLVTPEGLTFDSGGRLYISDCEGFRIFRLEAPGRVKLVAGVGGEGYGQYSGDDGPALEAELGCPVQMAFDADGNLDFADHAGNRVREIDSNGIVTTIAGSGPAGINAGSLAGDGGPAAKARLQEPTGLVVDANGNLFVADRDNERIREIAPDGTITTFAGTKAGFGGDGGPAVKAKLWDPYYMAIGPDGSLYFADNHNGRVRKVDRGGVITTIAGNGKHGSGGDGGPATKAALNEPYGLAFDAEGNLYVSQAADHVVRKIDPNGIISTVAGTGLAGFSGDGGPAVDAMLNSPAGLAVDTDGNLYIADYNNHRVRVVDPKGLIRTIAGND